MEITPISNDLTSNLNNLNSIMTAEQKPSAENPESNIVVGDSGSAAKTSQDNETASKATQTGDNASKTVQDNTPPVSERMTIASGGTVTHSVDGDTVELSGQAISASASAQTSASASSSASTSADNSAVEESKAITMILQGSSDSKIKEQTGISQEEINKLKQSLDKASIIDETD